MCVSADRRHNECVGQDQTQNVCVGIEPYARACQQQLIECAFTGPGPPSRPRAMASLKAQRLLPIANSKSIISIKSIKSIESIEPIKSIKSCMIRMAPNFHTVRAVSSYSYSRGRSFHISVPTWYHTGTVPRYIRSIAFPAILIQSSVAYQSLLNSSVSCVRHPDACVPAEIESFSY